MDEKATMSWMGRSGRKISCEVNLSIPNIQDFIGHAGYIWLVIAANPHLSISQITEWAADNDPNAYRPKTWIAKRRWMFHEKFRPGVKSNQDGKDARARKIMAEHSELSLRDLREVLAQRGIDRGKDWIRLHRCE